MKTALKDLIEKLQKFRLIKEDENSYELFRQLELESLEKEKEQFDDMFEEGFESAYQHFVNGKVFVKFEDYYNQVYNQNK